MGYNQSTYIFYGIEIEADRNEYYEFIDDHSHSGNPITAMATGDYSTGTHERYWIIYTPTLHQLSHGKYETDNAFITHHIDNEVNFALYDFAIEHNLKFKHEGSYPSWVGGACGQ